MFFLSGTIWLLAKSANTSLCSSSFLSNHCFQCESFSSVQHASVRHHNVVYHSDDLLIDMVWQHDAPDNTLIMSHNAVDCWFVCSLDDIVILTRQHWKAMWACDARAPAEKCYNLLENSELELSFSLRGNNQLKLSFSLRGLLKQRVPTKRVRKNEL